MRTGRVSFRRKVWGRLSPHAAASFTCRAAPLLHLCPNRSSHVEHVLLSAEVIPRMRADGLTPSCHETRQCASSNAKMTPLNANNNAKLTRFVATMY